MVHGTRRKVRCYQLLFNFRCAVKKKAIYLTLAQGRLQVSSNVDSRVVKTQKPSMTTTDGEQGQPCLRVQCDSPELRLQSAVATSATCPQSDSLAQRNDDTITGAAHVLVEYPSNSQSRNPGISNHFGLDIGWGKSSLFRWDLNVRQQ